MKIVYCGTHQNRNIMYRKILFVLFSLSLPCISLFGQPAPRPNIILIMTDDQGYGDFGFTGNPHIKTPNLDQLASESVQFENFYVSPVCAPTRSSLLTGRYSLRTGIHDTYNGGAIMATEEITIAEMLKEAGYNTGIFGKWHLGDNYPSRPGDQGFDESLIHLSGGMGQVGDFTTYFQKDSSYYDPVLWHNGKQKKYDGYCSDIFTEEAINFISQKKDEPFFCYLSFNAPHTPLQVPQKYIDMYADLDPSDGFTKEYPELENMSERDIEAARKIYAMVTNIDDNIGNLLTTLKENNLEKDTWVIFLTDNGPQQNRYKAGLRGLKGSVYRGGVRVPCLMRYPAEFSHRSTITNTAAHLDILPTIGDLCQIPLPADRIIDGQSLVPILKNKSRESDDRTLFFYWTRKYPEKYNNMAIQHGTYKLVGNTSYDSPSTEFELYNLANDPGERVNIVDKERSKAQSLKNRMDQIYSALIKSTHIISPPRILVGHAAENPVLLNRNDAAGERGIWNKPDVYGYWNTEIRPGTYNVRFRFTEPISRNGRLILEAGPYLFQKPVSGNDQTYLEMNNVSLPSLKTRLTATLILGRDNILPFWIELTRTD